MADSDEQQSSSEHVGPPAVVGVFLNREIIVEHYKTVADAINSNDLLQKIAQEQRVVVIAKKKSGFTRQLLIGPLDAQPYEYTLADWKVTTQNYQHLPDIMSKRRPGLIIVVGEDAQLLIGVLHTVYANSRKLTDADVRHIIEAAKEDLRMGDVVLYKRDGYSAEDPGGVFEILFSLFDE